MTIQHDVFRPGHKLTAPQAAETASDAEHPHSADDIKALPASRWTMERE